MTQRDRRRRRRIGIGAAFTAAVVGISLATLPLAANAADPAPPADLGDVLDKLDQELLSDAREAGERTVDVLVAAEDGTGTASVEQLRQAGAKIKYRADELGYVRAEVPVDSVGKVAKLPAVDAIDVDGAIELDNPRPEGIQNPTPQPPPDANTPRVNAYMPTGDTGAAQFAEANPAFDGRGVTVGVVDSGIDLGHPSLNTTSTGERKIVDWVTYTEPGFTGGVNNDDDPTWIDMSKPGAAARAGYATPRVDDLRFGLFDERDPRLGGEVGNDVNRDGNPAGSIGLFGVLWDPATNTVWVDVNQNKNFTDDAPMTDYKVKFDVGTFGKDNPATSVREAMPFVVQTSPATESVNIGIVADAHGSHVAGIVAGNSLFGGAMNGAAPGAKLVSVRACLHTGSCTSHALLEGMIYAARDANVDVINMSIGGLPARNDGNNTRAIMYNRLIDEFDVQMFISAGNSGAGENTVGDPSVADKVVSVGSYITKATWQRNYGSDAAREENMHGFSSRGPREDGGFKPTLIAPGAAVSTTPTWQFGSPTPGTYVLPPGYAMFNGTSMASPQSAGAAALLVSAAIAKKVSHTPEQLRQALTSSARFIPNFQAYEQGNGLIDVKKAWNLLKANIATIDVTSQVAVNTILSGELQPTPNVGVGIHDREGVKAGDNYVREYTFTRTTGSASPITYQVKWVGNDGTFAAPPTITLRKGAAVKFRVTVNPRTAGIHSAILNLDSPMSTGIEYQTLNTVVAAEDFTAPNGFTVKKGGTIGRNEVRSFFVRVAPKTPALKIDLQGGGPAAGAGQLRFLRFHPAGVPFDSNASVNCYNPPVPPGNACNDGEDPTSRTAINPTPGVWEIVVEARRTSDSVAAPFTMTATVLGATVSPHPDTIESAKVGQALERSYELTNSFGPFTGRAVGTTLGSAKLDKPTIAAGQTLRFPVTVTEGATTLRAKIGNTADGGADLDLFVWNCTTGICNFAGSSADGDSEEEVVINNPKPGAWRVDVIGFAVSQPTTTFDYLDVFGGTSFGTIALTDANEVRPAGATWTVPATVTAGVVPASGRVLMGNIEVRNDSDILIGTGDVVIQTVTP